LFQKTYARPEIAGYPSLGYSTETGFYGGGSVYLRYRPESFNETVPKNIFYITSEYSEKKQYSLKFEPKIHLLNGLYTISSKLKYNYWPSNFYGIGNDNNKNDSEKFTSNEFSFILDWQRRLSDNLAISLMYDFSKYEIEKMEEDGLLDVGSIPGNEGGINSGLGWQISYNRRNAEFYPTKGGLYSFQMMSFNKTSGCDFDYLKYSLDLREYFSSSETQVIALQGYFSFIKGDPPFDRMSYLDDHMRGVTANLFIDHHAAIIRTEYRVFPWQYGFRNRLGFIVFLETGQVAHEFNEFAIENLKLNYGFGFRFSFLLEDRLNLRFDVGFGEVNGNISMSSREVF
jgi:hypothetical protein